MKTVFLVGAAVTLLGVAAVAAPAIRDGNLVVNGSFEDGPAVPGDKYQWVDKGSAAIKGWVVTRGQIDLIGAKHWAAADGKRSLDLHGSPGLGGVMQKIKTKKDQKYRVTFSLAANPQTAKKAMSMGVNAAGQNATFKAEPAADPEKGLGWVTKTWDFTAAGDETELEFYTLETDEPFSGPALDNVTVTATGK